MDLEFLRVRPDRRWTRWLGISVRPHFLQSWVRFSWFRLAQDLVFQFCSWWINFFRFMVEESMRFVEKTTHVFSDDVETSSFFSIGNNSFSLSSAGPTLALMDPGGWSNSWRRSIIGGSAASGFKARWLTEFHKCCKPGDGTLPEAKRSFSLSLFEGKTFLWFYDVEKVFLTFEWPWNHRLLWLCQHHRVYKILHCLLLLLRQNLERWIERNWLYETTVFGIS